MDACNYIDMVCNYINEESMLSMADSLVIGVSGGADSVALLCIMEEVCQRMGIPAEHITVVHINHMLRGAEADLDEEFVRRLCEAKSIQCKIYRKDIKAFANDMGLTVEEAGRMYRYQCFYEEAQKNPHSKIAVAHNKNDVAETILFNISRGCGLNGLSGIRAKRDNIIRPLLFLERKQIEEYLDLIKQEFRTDSTNLTLDYDRNKLRHIVLPELGSINQGVLTHLCELANEAAASYAFIHEQAEKMLFLMNRSEDEERFVLPRINLIENDTLLTEHIIHEAIARVAGKRKDITRKHICEVKGLLKADTGKQVSLPYDIIARNNYDSLIIEHRKLNNKFKIDITAEGEYNLPDEGKVILKVINHDKMTDISELIKKDYTIILDYDKMKDTLCIRNPEEGDYITIDKSGNQKKLSRVFIDKKIDRVKREGWPVIAIGHEVIWAVGLRYNEAYRVDEATKKIIQIEYVGGKKDGGKN